MRRSTLVFAAACALALITAGRAAELGPPRVPPMTELVPAASADGSGLWHFAVDQELGYFTMLTWPAVPDPSSGGLLPAKAFMVQTCQAADCAFDASEVLSITPTLNGDNTAWVAVNWHLAPPGRRRKLQAPVGPYYRVAIVMPTPEGPQPIAMSDPHVAYAQSGNLFVVNNPALPTAGCGSLTSDPTTGPWPCPTIQSAIDAASNGSTIYVTPGVWTGAGNRDLDFGSKKLTLQSTNGRDMTALQAQYGGRVLSITGGQGRETVVSGFSILNGTAEEGGCIKIEGASPTLRDLFFFGCLATGAGRGGAIAVRDAPGAGPLIEDSAFIYNLGQEGGALAVYSSETVIERCNFQYSLCMGGSGMGGGFYTLSAPNVTFVDTNFLDGYVGYTGAAGHLEQSTGTFIRVRMTGNQASSFAAALALTASGATMIDSEVSRNNAFLYAGGVQAFYSVFNATRSKFMHNTAAVGGGGIKSLGGLILLSECEVSFNSAKYGAAFDIYKLGDIPFPPTGISMNHSVVEGNTAQDYGAGFALTAHDLAVFLNVTFKDNIAAAKGGGGWCGAATLTQLYSCTFYNNTAAQGGGFFAEQPCNAQLMGTTFESNAAAQYGGAVAATDGTTLAISFANFTTNGLSLCPSSNPPLGGGAVAVGIEQFTVGSACGAATDVTYATINIANSTFVGNVARDKGGALLLSAGTLGMEGVQLEANHAQGGVNLDGVGGGLALVGRCSNDVCAPVVADLVGLNLIANTGSLAGGGIFYTGENAGSSLSLTESVLLENSVDTALEGVGGGMFIGRPNFIMESVQADSNSAFYGGAVFISADMSVGAQLGAISTTGNAAVLGPAAFWLRSKSPAAELVCQDCMIEPSTQAAMATEVLSVGFGAAPPAEVQSAKPITPGFTVQLLDFYANIGATDFGDCLVSSDQGFPTDSNGPKPAVVQSTGSMASIIAGVANFTGLQVQGTIEQYYTFSVDCTPLTKGRTKYLNANPLGALRLPLTMGSCPPGTEPVDENTACRQCSPNFYSLDGLACLACPQGADCTNGLIEAAPGWWRSDATSVGFYECSGTSVCTGELPPWSGDVDCEEGHEGLLCAVCKTDYFKFAGKCTVCKGGHQSKAMLAVTSILFAVMVLAIFARSWGSNTGPGILTKVKIFLTHFQMIALFRDYDVVWPTATHDALSWFEVFNIGLSMAAPECIIGAKYSFYYYYVFEMAIPLICVAVCVGVYLLAAALLAWLDPTKERRQEPKTLPAWLEGLKIRCWKNSFWLVTLLYPRCAMTALQLFSLHKLNTGTFLKVDYNILVRAPGGDLSSTYIKYMIPGIILLIIFAVGIPAFWVLVIFLNRKNLKDPVVMAKYGFLYGSYSPRLPYWETTEMLRKFIIALIPVFIKAQSVGSLQASVGMIVLLVYIVATVWLQPFALAVDNTLQVASMIVLWLLLLSSSIAKWANLNSHGESGLEIAQLLLSSAVGFMLLSGVAFSGLRLLTTAKRTVKKRMSVAAARKSMNEGAGKAPGDAPALTIRVTAGPASVDGEGDVVASPYADDTPHAQRTFLNASQDELSAGAEGAAARAATQPEIEGSWNQQGVGEGGAGMRRGTTGQH